MIMHKTTYKCDICGKESEKQSEMNGNITIDFEDTSFNGYTHDIEYKQVCPECAHKVSGFIVDLKIKNTPCINMEELEQLCDE